MTYLIYGFAALFAMQIGATIGFVLGSVMAHAEEHSQ